MQSPLHWHATAKLRHELKMRLMHPPKRSSFVRMLAAIDARAVLDIGANRGQTGTLLRDGGYAGQIVSCEPLPDDYAILATAADPDARWATRQVAVGAEPGEAELHISGRSTSSSILPLNDRLTDLSPDTAYVGSVQVPVVTVGQLLTEFDLDVRRTVLKADVQGYEWQVLDGAGTQLSDLAGVVIEMNLAELYAGQRLFHDLVERLIAAGHRLWNIEPGHVDKVDGRMLWCDGLFVRADIADAAPTHRIPG